MLGNHEFDLGVEGLAPFLKDLPFPVISANIDASGEPLIEGLFAPYTIITVGGESIGVVGYSTKDIPELVSPGEILS